MPVRETSRGSPSAPRSTRGLGIVASVAIAASAGLAVLSEPLLAAPQSPPSAHPLLADVTFDFVWTRVRDTYYDPGMGGVDWEGVRAELRPRALAAESPAELRGVLLEMLATLGESHFTIIPGAAADAFGVGESTPAGDAHPGVDVRWIDGELLVTGVAPGSPADAAGIRAGWILDAIGGAPIDTLAARIAASVDPDDAGRELALWLPTTADQRLRGRASDPVRLALRDGSGGVVVLDVGRGPPSGDEVRFGNLPPLRAEVSAREVSLDAVRRVGIVRWSVWFPAVTTGIAAAVDRFREADGLVLDLRGNPGGLGALAMAIGGHFLDEPVSLGTMRTRDSELRFVVNPQRVTPDGRRVQPFDGPVAILIDSRTASTSEFFAGGLQAIGRARLFGEPTAGQALPAVVVDLPNGDRMMHVVADFSAADGSRLEGRGVRPDVLAAPSRESLLAGEDTALEAALDWLRTELAR